MKLIVSPTWRVLILLLVIAYFVIALIGYEAHAATPLPPAPTNGWCFDAFTSTGYNGVRACPQPPPPPPPPSGRITTSNIAYVPATGSVRFTSITECSAIWGHASPFDAEIPWPPGRPNAQPSLLNFTRTGYVGCHFRAPTTPNAYGWITHTEYNAGFDPTWSISSSPGDFAPLGVLCHGEASSGQNIAFFTNAPNVYRTFCGLVPGADYYLNIKPTNPAEDTSTCPSSHPQCVFGTANASGH